MTLFELSVSAELVTLAAREGVAGCGAAVTVKVPFIAWADDADPNASGRRSNRRARLIAEEVRGRRWSESTDSLDGQSA